MVGLVVGDALGVPVEFSDREERKQDPVIDMRGYGTHNQPPGTWSDDSSMAIATLDWFREFRNDENNKFLDDLDYSKLMNRFSGWMMNGEYTPHGRNFDIGIATSKAIMNYARGMEPLKCGGVGEYDNGNGSLMRILPASLFFHVDFGIRINKSYVSYIYSISSLTHGHGRSRLACLIYTTVIANIFRFSQLSKQEVVTNAIATVHDYLLNKEDDPTIKSEINSYNRLWNIDSFSNLSENEIGSSGYVVDTLEAAIWCFLTTESYRECVLKAVNLGEDTDTVGAVAGGIAGMYYGIENIPGEWVNVIPKIDQIMKLTKDVMKMKIDYDVSIVCGDKTYNI
ncbi:MAG: ADP-ribosylglycohydrolase family protein [Eubacterium sp.]|nr:ADP-ribosylglycohydrolase family protein [Eubacterium sp.]